MVEYVAYKEQQQLFLFEIPEINNKNNAMNIINIINIHNVCLIRQTLDINLVWIETILRTLVQNN